MDPQTNLSRPNSQRRQGAASDDLRSLLYAPPMSLLVCYLTVDTKVDKKVPPPLPDITCLATGCARTFIRGPQRLRL